MRPSVYAFLFAAANATAGGLPPDLHLVTVLANDSGIAQP